MLPSEKGKPPVASLEFFSLTSRLSLDYDADITPLYPEIHQSIRWNNLVIAVTKGSVSLRILNSDGSLGEITAEKTGTIFQIELDLPNHLFLRLDGSVMVIDINSTFEDRRIVSRVVGDKYMKIACRQGVMVGLASINHGEKTRHLVMKSFNEDARITFSKEYDIGKDLRIEAPKEEQAASKPRAMSKSSKLQHYQGQDRQLPIDAAIGFADRTVQLCCYYPTEVCLLFDVQLLTDGQYRIVDKVKLFGPEDLAEKQNIVLISNYCTLFERGHRSYCLQWHPNYLQRPLSFRLYTLRNEKYMLVRDYDEDKYLLKYLSFESTVYYRRIERDAKFNRLILAMKIGKKKEEQRIVLCRVRL